MTVTTALIALLAFAPAADEVDAKQVRQLVRLLDSGGLADREDAQAQLIKLGPAVLDLLPDARADKPEQARRLAEIREELLAAAVEAAARGRLVTLDADEILLSDALAAIEKQTGNKLIDKRADFGQEAPDPKLKLKFDETPFWEALDKVLDEAGLTVYGFSDEPNAIALIAAADRLPRSDHAAYSGVFRVEATRIEAVRDLRRRDDTGLSLSLEIAWEPRLTPMALALPFDELVGKTEDGDELGPPISGGGVQPEVYPGMTTTEVVVPLELPPRTAETLTKVTGKIEVLMPGRREDFTFGDLKEADDVTIRKGAAAVLLQGVRKNGSVQEVFMVLQFDKAANALESHRDWVSGNEAFLIDGEGKRVSHVGFNTTRQTENEFGVAYRFVPDGPIENYRFVYRSPAAIVKKIVPFELKDLPLP